MVRGDEEAAVGRTEAEDGWRRRIGWPLTKSDLSITGDDLRRDAEAIGIIKCVSLIQNLISLLFSNCHIHIYLLHNVPLYILVCLHV